MTIVEICEGRLNEGRHIADADVRMLLVYARKLEAALIKISEKDYRCIHEACGCPQNAVELADEVLGPILVGEVRRLKKELTALKQEREFKIFTRFDE